MATIYNKLKYDAMQIYFNKITKKKLNFCKIKFYIVNSSNLFDFFFMFSCKSHANLGIF